MDKEKILADVRCILELEKGVEKRIKINIPNSEWGNDFNLTITRGRISAYERVLNILNSFVSEDDNEEYQRLLYWTLMEKQGQKVPWNGKFVYDHINGLVWFERQPITSTPKEGE